MLRKPISILLFLYSLPLFAQLGVEFDGSVTIGEWNDSGNATFNVFPNSPSFSNRLVLIIKRQ